jgi:N-acetylglucosamine-6-phosphate deacetylase
MYTDHIIVISVELCIEMILHFTFHIAFYTIESMPQDLFIRNCDIVSKGETRSDCNILIENGAVADVGRGLKPPPHIERLDAQGRVASPGFIDVHIQGAGGADVLDGSEESLRTMAKSCLRFGVTSFLATTVYKPGQHNGHLREASRCTGRDLGGARLEGIHLEGPFISPSKRGMIQPDSICNPELDELGNIFKLTDGTLKIMTIAPELENSLQIIGRLRNEGVVASFGHSAATLEQTALGIEAGISHVTHLFNTMPSLHHREPGPLPAIFESDLDVQIIPDGVHVHPSILQLACRIIGCERVIAITDGMQAMGLPEGIYEYNSLRYRSLHGTARYEDGTLIGTALGMNECLKRLKQHVQFSWEQTLRTATVNPARVLGLQIDDTGIYRGMRGDIVLLDSAFSVFATIVSGKIVYRA